MKHNGKKYRKKRAMERRLDELRQKLEEEDAAKLELERELERLRQSSDEVETFDKAIDTSSDAESNEKTREYLEAELESLSEAIEARREEAARLENSIIKRRVKTIYKHDAEDIVSAIGSFAMLIGLVVGVCLLCLGWFLFSGEIYLPSVSGIVWVTLLSVLALMCLTVIICVIVYMSITGWKNIGNLIFLIPIALIVGLTLESGLLFKVKTFDLAKDGIVYNYNDDGTLTACGGEAYIKNIVIPRKIGDSRVIAVGDNAFFYNHKIESVTVSYGVTTIEACAFGYCEKLAGVVIPDSVTEIVWGAFTHCTALKSIIIPDSVTAIGTTTFDGCENLTVYCEAESAPEDWSMFWSSSVRAVVWGYEGYGRLGRPF